MGLALPSLPHGQMAKLDNMLSKITLKSHRCAAVLSPARLYGEFTVRPGERRRLEEKRPARLIAGD